MNLIESTVQPTEKGQAMPLQLHDATQSGGLIVTFVMTVIGAVLMLRRKVSKNNLDVTRDETEKNILDTLREERDIAKEDARKAWDTRTADAAKIAELTATVTHQKADLARLTTELATLRELVHALRNQLHLNELQKRPGALPP